MGHNELVESIFEKQPTKTSLTAREATILKMRVEGKSNREIAEALSISKKGVEGHVGRIQTYLGADPEKGGFLRKVVELVREGSLDVPTPELEEPLTSVDEKVLDPLMRGLSNREIGLEISLAVSTIDDHLSEAYRKLGASNRLQAAVRYTRLKMRQDSQANASNA